MRTQWTANGNRDAGSSCLCDRGLHRYLQNLGGGLNTPNPPSRYATAAILPTEDFSCVFWTSCGSFDRCHASNARYSTCIIMQMALDNGDTLWTGLRLISPSLKPSCWREYVIRKDKARVLSLSLSLSLSLHSSLWLRTQYGMKRIPPSFRMTPSFLIYVVRATPWTQLHRHTRICQDMHDNKRCKVKT